MYLKTYFILNFLFLLSLQITGQESIEEKIAKSWKTTQEAKTDEEKLSHLYQTITFAEKLGLEEIEKYLEQTEALFLSCNSEVCQYWKNRINGFEASINRDFDKSEAYYNDALEKAKAFGDDLLAAHIYLSLGNLSQDQDEYEVSVKHYGEAQKIYAAQNKKDELAMTLKNTGISFDLLKEGDEAIKLYDQVLSMKSEIDEDIYKSALYNKALVLDAQGKKMEALAVYLKTTDFLKKSKNKKGLALVYEQIGRVNSELYDFENAIKYSKLSEDIWIELNDNHRLAYFYLESNRIYKMTGEFDKALLYAKKGYELSLEFKDEYAQAGNAIEIGNILLAKELGEKSLNSKYDSQHYLLKKEQFFNKEVLKDAYYYYNIALEIGKKHEIPSIHGTGLWGIGRTYFYQGEYVKALKCFREQEQLEENDEDVQSVISTKEYISLAEYQVGDHKAAFDYFVDMSVLKDSIYNVEKVQEAAKLQADFQFEKERETTALIHQAALDQEALIRNFLIGGAAILGLFLVLLYRNYREKQQINQQLEQLNLTKDRIFAVLGHDLRKPVISFRGVTEKLHYLLQQENYKGVEKLGHQLEKNAFSLHQVTDNLLSWALTQKDALSYEPEQVKVADAIEEVVSVFSNILEEKNIKLTTSVLENDSLWTDLNSFKVIIRNLVDNAIKYSNPGGEIIIEFEENKDGAFLKIKDFGVGIPAEKLEKIFDLQKKKSQPGTKGEKGTGLGLYLVQQLVQKNKGKINVFTELKKGTTFELVYPKLA